MIIKEIFINIAWQALYLTKQGSLGFFTNPKNNNKNNRKLPNGNDFSISDIGKERNNKIFKKGYLQNK